MNGQAACPSRRSARWRWPAIPTGLLLLLAACGSPPPDEQQIRQHIEQMAAALAERDVRRVMAPVAEDFSAETWNIDRRGMRLVLQRQMHTHDRLRARVFDLSVQMHGDDRASATFQLVLSGGSGLVPERGRWLQVSTGWRRQGSDWQLISAAWEDSLAR